MRRPILIPALILALAACGPSAQVPGNAERIAIAQGEARVHDPLPSPDTSNAAWWVDPSGRAIHFGDAGAPPHLSLDCQIGDGPSRLTIIRHALALPGEEALFPIYGNGMRSRFLADATLHQGQADSEWRWEAAVPAGDPQLDVFLGARELKATLPGKGMLEIGGSRIPGEFIDWCRAGGRIGAIAEEERTGS